MLMRLVGAGPDRSGIAVREGDVTIRMGWSFSGRGDWLVNGAGDSLVEVLFDPPMRARVVGFPVRVRRLRVAVDDPEGLVSALGGGGLE